MERYNIKYIEKKWQDIWYRNKTNAAVLDKKKKKILLSGNVSLPFGQDSYGSCS